jgi:hypothetical protein
MFDLKVRESNTLKIRFSEVALNISRLAAEVGIRIKPFFSENLPFFSLLSIPKKTAVVEAASSYVEVCEQSKKDGKLADSRTFVWNGIKNLGLRPTSDLFSVLTNDHIVEIHDFNARQLFRNLNYFQFSSYDLESLLCRDIQQLFSYEETAIKYLRGWFQDVESGKWSTLRPFNIPATHIAELGSPLKYKLKVDFIYGAPLYDSAGNPSATISLENAKIVKSANSVLGEEALLNDFYKGPPDLRLL